MIIGACQTPTPSPELHNLTAITACIAIAEANRDHQRGIRIILLSLSFELDLFFEPQMHKVRIIINDLECLSVIYIYSLHEPSELTDMEQLIRPCLTCQINGHAASDDVVREEPRRCRRTADKEAKDFVHQPIIEFFVLVHGHKPRMLGRIIANLQPRHAVTQLPTNKPTAWADTVVIRNPQRTSIEQQKQQRSGVTTPQGMGTRQSESPPFHEQPAKTVENTGHIDPPHDAVAAQVAMHAPTHPIGAVEGVHRTHGNDEVLRNSSHPSR
ncbi:hypothetical protein [Corynebacterium jeikeium]|uniref:hypothetical protein n=1 Tax=Corynebacterium jeikeium TaxID=38289 RepID=UPI0008D9B9BB|nr:hypothetical protein [Corynebacterium jeikeium]